MTLVRIKDTSQQAALAVQVASGQLTRDALAGIVKVNGSDRHATATHKPTRFKAELSEGRIIVVSGGGLDTPEVLIAWLEEVLGKGPQAPPEGLTLTTIARLFRDEAKT